MFASSHGLSFLNMFLHAILPWKSTEHRNVACSAYFDSTRRAKGVEKHEHVIYMKCWNSALTVLRGTRGDLKGLVDHLTHKTSSIPLLHACVLSSLL